MTSMEGVRGAVLGDVRRCSGSARDSPTARARLDCQADPRSRTTRRLLSCYRCDCADSPPWLSLDVLSGVDDFLDAAKRFRRLAHEGLDVHDPLPLLAGDLRPVVGVAGAGQVLVLLDLLADGGEQVVDHDALWAAGDVALQSALLGPTHHGLDHGAGREVLEVEDLRVAVGVGDSRKRFSSLRLYIVSTVVVIMDGIAA